MDVIEYIEFKHVKLSGKYCQQGTILSDLVNKW